MTAAASVRIAACDLNGQARGKRLPAGSESKLGSGAVRMPFSALNVDVSGADIEDSPLVFGSGDADGVLLPTGRGPVPMPWLERPALLYPMWMVHDDQSPFAGDPRQALARVLAGYARRGWQVIAATEHEFYLVDDSALAPQVPVPPDRSGRLFGDAILSITQLDAFAGFFDDLYDACDAMGLPAQSAMAESGRGQFEVNLDHQDALRAADDAWLFKILVRGLARKHGLAATFMAKPFAERAGNGMHIHFSVVDADGRNVFDDGGARGTALLRHAVAGCLAAMPASTLIFAPHGISYDRFVDNAHAPTAASWGYENRTAALRIPGGAPAARRIEHRVAGGDTNPYLVFAAVLGAALSGIEATREPPAPVTGNAYASDLPGLAPDWAAAVDAFAASPEIAAIFAPELVENLVLTKRQELRMVAGLDAKDTARLYLESV